MRGLTGVLLLVVLVATGCSGTPGGDPRPAGPSHTTITLLPETVPAGIGVSFVQQTIDAGSRRADVRVRNGTGRPLPVTAVGVDWPGFPGRVQPVDYTVPARSVIDLHYRLPRPDCRPGSASAPMNGVVVVPGRRIVRPIPAAGRRFLHRLHGTACDAREVAAHVTPAWDVSGRPAEVESGTRLDAVRRAGLVLTRRPRHDPRPVRVTQVRGSVLFELALAGSARLPADRRRTSVPIAISPGRCDEHARSQSTQTFVWRIWLRVGGGRALPLVLEPPRGRRAALLAWLDRACAGHTGH